MKIRKIPGHWGTSDIHQALMSRGNISSIGLFESRSDDTHSGWVVFRPAPKATQPSYQTMSVTHSDGAIHQIELIVDDYKLENSGSQFGSFKQKQSETICLPANRLEVGVLEKENKMKGMFLATPVTKAPVQLGLNTRFNVIEIKFGLKLHDTHLALGPNGGISAFKIKIPFSQIRKIYILPHNKDHVALIFDFKMPPKLYRKATCSESTHDPKSFEWNEDRAWYRQVGIRKHPEISTELTSLQQKGCILDLGRWLLYRITIDRHTASSEEFSTLMRLLAHHNIESTDNFAIDFEVGEPEACWAWTDEPSHTADTPINSALLSRLHVAASPLSQLNFAVRYRLAVCLSQNTLHESNITHAFVEKLLVMGSERAVKLLEKVSDGERRYFDPGDIFGLQGQVSRTIRNTPSYCAMIPSAVVTPSTIYFAAPIMEPSNRIVRQYSHYQDRFLRVKFSDERYVGKIFNSDDNTTNEIFTRIKRTMRNGIKVADHHYEFLAFSNSQMRENGAYFFAAIGEITAESIRAKMGNFTNINVVAKYAARIGQCLSTTRAMSIGVQIETISDIERNGCCFTDGVGKISPFMAQMIADEYGLFNTYSEYPSVFQYRLGGHKGVLAIDPGLKGPIIQTRRSQKKFPAEHRRLEICRISTFASAYLNVQIILVLESLGVPTPVFIHKMKEIIVDLKAAISDENIALEQLCRHVDFNGMTLKLAEMIRDGFMASADPFMTSCVRLWVAWMIKYLKEKARIFVNQGAFVLGCVDETATLQGHFSEHMEQANEELSETTCLPEIFLQVPDPDRKGMFKVVTGICILARNPSLHPGDIRVVRAVDVPALRHLKNCVVLPQTGDRALANMCSGGDLDGDDYLVMWDPDLIPPEWNHTPMGYEGSQPVQNNGPVTVDDVTSFFVMHMKNNNLPRIATAHRFWADRNAEGVKSRECLELARLHSVAVDYAKTGVPAQFPDHLRFKGQYPHWSERRNVYKSKKVIGQLYDLVDRMPFHPAWEQPFDNRVLGAYELDEQIKRSAREVKLEYDMAVRRLMAQYGIRDEFQVWTAFVMDHNQDSDYKFAQDFGEKVSGLKRWARDLCYAKADASAQDWYKIAPFIVAMYTITAMEIGENCAAYRTEKVVRAQDVEDVEDAQPTFENMPLMSFPWIFSTELGHIANKRQCTHTSSAQQTTGMAKKSDTKWSPDIELLRDDVVDIPLRNVETGDGAVHEGDLLDINHLDEEERERDAACQPHDAADMQQTFGAGSAASSRTAASLPVLPRDSLTAPKGPAQANTALIVDPTKDPVARGLLEVSEVASSRDQPVNHDGIDECWERHDDACERDGEDSDDEAGEVVVLDMRATPSALDALNSLVGG